MRKLVLLCAGLMVSLAFDAAQAQRSQRSFPLVEVSPVVETVIDRKVEIPGTVLSAIDSNIAAQISGAVTWIAEEGSQVEKGGVLARLDARDWEFSRKDAESQIKRLEARLAQREANLQRLERLAQQNNAALTALDEARADLADIRQELVQAETALQRAQVNLERTVIRSPFAGQVVRRLAQLGEYATPGSDIVRLVNISELIVRVQLPNSMIEAISVDQSLVVLDARRQVNARTKALIAAGDEVTRTVELQLSLPDNNWAIGSAVRVLLPAAQPRTVLAVSRDALIFTAEASYVLRVNDEGRIDRIPVSVGDAQDELIEVIGDLQIGQNIVIRGGDRLRQGEQVQIANMISGL